MTKGLLSQLPSPPAGKTGWPWTEETNPEIYANDIVWTNISIVTPSYNQGQFIEETIRSILLQNYHAIEYIIIDGGSTDETVSIIKKYEPWITYWVSEKDNGQTNAINKGIEKCHGEFFNWVNSDDYLVPDALHTLISRLQKAGDEVGMVSGDVIIINEEGVKQKAAVPDIKNIFYEYMAGTAVHQPATLFNLNAIKILGPLDERLHYSMCLQMMLQVNMAGKGEYVNKEIIVTRLHPDSKSVIAQHKFYPDRIKTYSKFFNYVPLKYRNEKLIDLLQSLEKEGYDIFDPIFVPTRFTPDNYIESQLFIAEKIARLYYFQNKIKASKKIIAFIKYTAPIFYKRNRLYFFNFKLNGFVSFFRKLKYTIL